MVLFTDAVIETRAQKMISHTPVRITESVFAHDQHREEQNILTALLTFLCLVCTQCPHILLHKSNTGETQTPKQFTNNYCIRSSSYRSVK